MGHGGAPTAFRASTGMHQAFETRHMRAPALDSLPFPSDTFAVSTFFVQARRMHDWLASRHRLRAPFGET